MDELKKDIPMPPLPEEVQEEVVQEELQQVVEQPAAEQPVVAQPVEEANEEVVKETQQSKEVQETPQQLNFRALRKEKERLAKENEEIQIRLAKYEESQSKPPEEDLEINIGDDDLFEGKHYKKLQKQLKKQQEELKNYQEQAKLTSTEAKLKSQYSDFDKVVSVENIRRLRESEPEIAETLASSKDVYSKAVSAYKMIKKLGIYVEDNYQQDRTIAKQNSLKPKPLASVSPQQGDSPLTKANAFANGLTKELKTQLRREMDEAIKNY